MNPVTKNLEELASIYEKKAQDYAGEEQYRNFKIVANITGRKPYEVMCDRAMEKFVRIAQLHGKEANFESIEDSLKDIIVLTCMALDNFEANK